MKEATGEASMTGITIAIIAIIAAIAVPIVTNLLSGVEKSSCCQADGGIWFGGKCYTANLCSTDENGKTTCSGTSYTPSCS